MEQWAGRRQPDGIGDGRAGGRQSAQVHGQRERHYRGNGRAISHSQTANAFCLQGKIGKETGGEADREDAQAHAAEAEPGLTSVL